jgi:CRISPR-associated protein Csx3
LCLYYLEIEKKKYGMAFHEAHGSAAGAVATYDPRLGAIVVASRSTLYKAGQVLDVE